MPVQEQKASPRVHRVPPKPKSDEAVTDTGEEAPVAVSVPLDSLEEPEVVEIAVSSSSLENEDEESALLLGPNDEEDDDADLSLLDEGEKTSKPMSQQEDPEEGFLEVFSENCLICRSLVPFAKKKFKACHFSSGNKHCPASQTQVVIRVPLEDIIPRFMSAEKANDFSRLARLNTKLSEKPDWYQARVAQALREARLKQS